MVDGRHEGDNSLPHPSVHPPKAATVPLCPVGRPAGSEAAVIASHLAPVAVAARLLSVPLHFCSVAPSKIDDEGRLLTVVAGGCRWVLERVLEIRQEVMRFLLRALVCRWDWPLQARRQEMVIPPTTTRM